MRSTSQPQFHSENTPATIEADQTLLTLQQQASKSKTANFTNNFNRFSKLPKCLATTTSTFDWKSEKFEFFEDLFRRCLKIHNQSTEDDKINNFHYFIHADALQTFRNISNQQPHPRETGSKSGRFSLGNELNPSHWLLQNTKFNN